MSRPANHVERGLERSTPLSRGRDRHSPRVGTIGAADLSSDGDRTTGPRAPRGGSRHTHDRIPARNRARGGENARGAHSQQARRPFQTRSGIIGEGKAAPTGHIPFTPRAKKVLELSFREARQLGHNYIGTEHILLGLIREGEGVAAQILHRLGADLKRVRQTVIEQLSESAAGTPEEILGTLPPEFYRGKPKSPFREREWIVLSLLIEGGMTTGEIAELLGISEEEVGEIIRAVIEKLKDV